MQLAKHLGKHKISKKTIVGKKKNSFQHKKAWGFHMKGNFTQEDLTTFILLTL